MCKTKFYEGENKIKEHDHLNGQYRGASCLSCNAKDGKSKIIPVFFHNGSGYDFHFLVEDQFNKVSVLPRTSEDYISVEFGNSKNKLRFLDSYGFLPKSLAEITKSLKDFPILDWEFGGDTELLKQKGVYPYDYIDSIERLDEPNLPPKEKFYSTLIQKGITEEEYVFAQKVWEHYECKSFLDYHNLYLKTDVLLLADAFEKCRDFFLEYHKIDPCFCFSAPGLTWQCGLKYTGIKLELLTDYDMLLMFEKGIRGGFSGVLGSRYVKAKNKKTLFKENEIGEVLPLTDNEIKKSFKRGKN